MLRIGKVKLTKTITTTTEETTRYIISLKVATQWPFIRQLMMMAAIGYCTVPGCCNPGEQVKERVIQCFLPSVLPSFSPPRRRRPRPRLLSRSIKLSIPFYFFFFFLSFFHK